MITIFPQVPRTDTYIEKDLQLMREPVTLKVQDNNLEREIQ